MLEVDREVEIYREGGTVRVVPFSPLGGRVVEIKRGRESPRGAYSYFDAPKGVSDEQADTIQGQAEGELLQTLNTLVEDNRAGIKEIIMPAENAADLDEIPSEVMSELNFHLVHDLDEVMDIALLDDGTRPRRPARPRKEAAPAEGASAL